ncbi:MAG: hypothetical protein LQ338_004741 [Usnochroma carphineum]|nr:MAG: hypothetical protein LQ338_004741 [Usnochroma carphineum]
MSSPTYSISDTQLYALQHRAAEAKANAYCPYSSFRVGAAFLAVNGDLIAGANVENASYPVGTCAERVALGKAVVDGYRRFEALAVATDVTPPASPCGMCRQLGRREGSLAERYGSIREFCGLEMPVFMFDKDGKYVVKTVGELLPMSFGPEDLKGGGGEGGGGGGGGRGEKKGLEVEQEGGQMEGEVAP